jgi:hypothetical protein
MDLSGAVVADVVAVGERHQTALRMATRPMTARARIRIVTSM